MTSLTQWTWVWASSGSWWWTGKTGVLQSVGSQRVGHGWATELNPKNYYIKRQSIWKLWLRCFTSFYYIFKIKLGLYFPHISSSIDEPLCNNQWGQWLHWWKVQLPGQGGKMRLTSRPRKHYHLRNKTERMAEKLRASHVQSWPEGHSASGLFSRANQSFSNCFSPLELHFQCQTQKPGCQPGSLVERVTPLMGSSWLLRGLRLILGGPASFREKK